MRCGVVGVYSVIVARSRQLLSSVLGWGLGEAALVVKYGVKDTMEKRTHGGHGECPARATGALVADRLAAFGHVEVEAERHLRIDLTRIHAVLRLRHRAPVAAAVAVVIATRPAAVPTYSQLPARG